MMESGFRAMVTSWNLARINPNKKSSRGMDIGVKIFSNLRKAVRTVILTRRTKSL